ncbi:MAG: PDZ domain-containing protein [Planctomycetota bacterium]
MHVKALRKFLWVANTLLVMGIVAYALFFFILGGAQRKGWRSGEVILTKRNLPEAAPDVKMDKVMPRDTFRICAELVIDGDLPPEIVDTGGPENVPVVPPLAQNYDLHWLMQPTEDVLGAVASLFHKSTEKYVHVQVGEYVEFKRTGKHSAGDWKLVAVSARTPWTAEFVSGGPDGEETRVTLDQVRDKWGKFGEGPPDGIKEIPEGGEGPGVSKVKKQPRERPTRELVETSEGVYDVPPEEEEWWGEYGEDEFEKKVALEVVKVDGKPQGLMFKSVEKDSMMERRGVRSGDILISINDKPVSSRQGVVNYVKGEGKGLSRYTVVIERNGKEITRTYNVKKK